MNMETILGHINKEVSITSLVINLATTTLLKENYLTVKIEIDFKNL